ncbi:MAG TPA: hypothetical protein DDX84_03040 [Nitrospiraceae bacterium]|nr:MAG: hypothetical protein A2035_05640 [Nitrospirae bacterium GWA2_42_11]HBI23190.1 hypothetical protein [Nitrospiraceae bacterium]
MIPKIMIESISLSTFLTINYIFLIKYGPQITSYYWTLLPIYTFFVLLSIKGLNYFSRRLSIKPFLLVGIICLFFTTAYLLLLNKIDPLTINVDRRSAITTFNTYLLSGEYPYLGKSHLGNPISGFPGLFIVSMPFQLMGDIGYFQVFSFLCFGFLVYKKYNVLSHRMLSLFLLGTSPIFLWEVAARSELFSNMILLLLFIFVCESVRGRKTYKNMILCGIVAGIIFSTRGIMLIPFIIYFTRYFKNNELKYALTFFLFLISIFSATILPFFLWDAELFLQHNPLFVQSFKIPKFLLIVVIIASLIAGIFTRGFEKFLLHTGYIIFITICIVFLLTVAKYGWTQTIYHHQFDISYFQFSTPFLLLLLFPGSIQNPLFDISCVFEYKSLNP